MKYEPITEPDSSRCDVVADLQAIRDKITGLLNGKIIEHGIKELQLVDGCVLRITTEKYKLSDILKELGG